SGHDPARAPARSISLSQEHRNTGRIALSPTGRRSISYEYCCPRRYMTSSTAWCSPKICTEARIWTSLPLTHVALFIPKCHVNRRRTAAVERCIRVVECV
ncbi:hypothetical protein WH47_08476, partial [Habropoda laboriosa]